MKFVWPEICPDLFENVSAYFECSCNLCSGELAPLEFRMRDETENVSGCGGIATPMDLFIAAESLSSWMTGHTNLYRTIFIFPNYVCIGIEHT